MQYIDRIGMLSQKCFAFYMLNEEGNQEESVYTPGSATPPE